MQRVAEPTVIRVEGKRVVIGICWACRWKGEQFSGRGSTAKSEAECREHDKADHMKIHPTLPAEQLAEKEVHDA